MPKGFNTAGPCQMDLCLRDGAVALGMELKVWQEGRPDLFKAELEQLDRIWLDWV